MTAATMDGPAGRRQEEMSVHYPRDGAVCYQRTAERAARPRDARASPRPRGFSLGIASRGTSIDIDEDELFEEEPVSDEEIMEILRESPWLRLRLRLLFWWLEIREWLGSRG